MRTWSSARRPRTAAIAVTASSTIQSMSPGRRRGCTVWPEITTGSATVPCGSEVPRQKDPAALERYGHCWVVGAVPPGLVTTTLPGTATFVELTTKRAEVSTADSGDDWRMTSGPSACAGAAGNARQTV